MIKMRIYKAAKPHKCSKCFGIIEQNEQYMGNSTAAYHLGCFDQHQENKNSKDLIL